MHVSTSSKTKFYLAVGFAAGYWVGRHYDLQVALQFNKKGGQ